MAVSRSYVCWLFIFVKPLYDLFSFWVFLKRCNFFISIFFLFFKKDVTFCHSHHFSFPSGSVIGPVIYSVIHQVIHPIIHPVISQVFHLVNLPVIHTVIRLVIHQGNPYGYHLVIHLVIHMVICTVIGSGYDGLISSVRSYSDFLFGFFECQEFCDMIPYLEFQNFGFNECGQNR